MKRCLFLMIVAPLLIGLPAAGQSTQFYPSVSAEVGYSDNLTYTPGPSSSDTAYLFSADLPVVRSWRTGSFSFRYQPSVYRYEESSLLDRTDHLASLGLQTELSRRSSLVFDTSFSRGQSQTQFVAPTSLNSPGTDIILTQRVDRDQFKADLGYSVQVTQKWALNLNVGAGGSRNEPIVGITGGLPVEDRDYTSIAAGMGRQLSQKTTLGFSLGYQENRLKLSGDEEISNADIVVSRQIGRQSSLNTSVGYYSTRSMIPGAPDRSGGQLDLGYNKSMRRVQFGLFAGYRPTSGGNTPGTATDTNVGLVLSGNATQVLLWDLGAQFAKRDPADPVQPEVDSRGVSTGLTWLASPKVGVRLRAGTYRQSVPGVPDTETLNATLGIVWFPRGQGRGQG